jgi:hypothetical protein
MLMADSELDVRRLRKPDKYPTISATYAAPALGESFVLEPLKSAVPRAV